MKILSGVLLLVYRFFHFLKWRLRLYLAWSKIYRWLRYRSEYSDIVKKLPLMSAKRAQENMDLVYWKKDNWKALWDALDSPERFHFFVRLNQRDTYVSKHTQPIDCNDCDEFAYYGTCVVPGSYFLSVSWMNDKKRYEGHNVCLCSKKTDNSQVAFFHIGNWGESKEFPSLKNLIMDILCGNKLIGWAIMNKDRNVLFQSRKNYPDINIETALFPRVYSIYSL